MNTKETNKANENHGIYIPIALAANNDLSWNEKAVYAVYHYFTFHGDLQLCTITKTALSKKLSLPLGTIKDICRRLKSKGYISTDGGIKTKALKNFEGFMGVEIQPHNNIMEGKTNPQDKTEAERGSKSNPKGVEIQRGEVEIQPLGGSKTNPIIKKENKELIKKNNVETNEKPINESVKESKTKLKPSSNEMEFDELLNSPSPQDIARVKRERVENITNRFFQSVEKHLQQHTQPLQSDINKIAQRLDEIDCKEARQLKRIMNDVLKNSFNGLAVYSYPTTTPSNVSALSSVSGGAYGDLPF